MPYTDPSWQTFFNGSSHMLDWIQVGVLNWPNWLVKELDVISSLRVSDDPCAGPTGVVILKDVCSIRIGLQRVHQGPEINLRPYISPFILPCIL